MLCRRSASLTSTTRTSVTMASSILRTLSACRASGSHQVEAADLGDAFDQTSRLRRRIAPRFARAESVSSITSWRRAARECRGVQAQVCQDVSDFQQMREVRLARMCALARDARRQCRRRGERCQGRPEDDSCRSLSGVRRSAPRARARYGSLLEVPNGRLPARHISSIRPKKLLRLSREPRYPGAGEYVLRQTKRAPDLGRPLKVNRLAANAQGASMSAVVARRPSA